MKITIEIPPEKAWLLVFYQEKAKLRSSLQKSSTVSDEIFIAVEQYALDCVASTPKELIDKIKNED